MEVQVVDYNDAERTIGVVNADDKNDGKYETVTADEHGSNDAKMNSSGTGECQYSSCDWSQPCADDTSTGYSVRFFREESSQGVDADDEHGDSSSSDNDWQEVEGLCISGQLFSIHHQSSSSLSSSSCKQADLLASKQYTIKYKIL